MREEYKRVIIIGWAGTYGARCNGVANGRLASRSSNEIICGSNVRRPGQRATTDYIRILSAPSYRALRMLLCKEKALSPFCYLPAVRYIAADA